jgi:hypothetical protein
MKKIIKLTESDLLRLVKRVINEKRFVNQSEVDRILDKISSEGMKSLTPEEKSILDNPDTPIEVETEELPSDESDNEDNFQQIYQKVKDGLDFLINKLPTIWGKVKMSSKKESIIEKINDLVTKIGQGIDAMEDMDADAYELNECKELFGDAMEYVNRILNED